MLSFVIWGSAHLPGHSGGPVSCDRTGEAGIMERMILEPVQLSMMGPRFYLCWGLASFSYCLGSAGKSAWLPHLHVLFLILVGRVVCGHCGFLITLNSRLSRCEMVPLCLWRGSGFLSMQKFDTEILGAIEALHTYPCGSICSAFP